MCDSSLLFHNEITINHDQFIKLKILVFESYLECL